jgi:ABC-type nitrate/sulfonate/bicarbonate transport system substrate-binding protein
VLQTTLQNTLLLSDALPTPATGGIVLKSPTGAMIVVNDSGIYIQNGKGASIAMVGPTVTVNNGGLVVI